MNKAFIIATCLAAIPACSQATSAFTDYLLHDNVYDENLSNNRVRFGIGALGAPLDMVQSFTASYERDIAGKISGNTIVGGSFVHGFSVSLQAVVRFRRDKRFRPLLYAGPTFATGSDSETWEPLCSCDAPGPYSEADPPYHGHARRITHPSLYATAGVGLQIRIWRGLGAEYRMGRHVRILGRDADLESTPELAAAAREYFRWDASPYSAFSGIFYEF